MSSWNKQCDKQIELYNNVMWYEPCLFLLSLEQIKEQIDIFNNEKMYLKNWKKEVNEYE